MTQQELQERFNKKMSEFFNEPCPVKMPEWFHKDFLPIFMNMNQTMVQFRMYTINGILKKIRAKEPEMITRHEASFMAQVWLTVPPVGIEKDIDKFLVKRLFLEDISGKLDFDQKKKVEAIEREQEALQKRRIIPAG